MGKASHRRCYLHRALEYKQDPLPDTWGSQNTKVLLDCARDENTDVEIMTSNLVEIPNYKALRMS